MPSEPVPDVNLPAPWAAFLDELDSRVPEPVALHCIGGFVLTVWYGVPRVTSDLDCVAVLPHHDLEAIAGRSPSVRQHNPNPNSIAERHTKRRVRIHQST